jgi:hypothetical protein
MDEQGKTPDPQTFETQMPPEADAQTPPAGAARPRPDLRQEMTGKAGRSTVPQIWIGDTHVGGCDDLYGLDREGRLDQLLAA